MGDGKYIYKQDEIITKTLKFVSMEFSRSSVMVTWVGTIFSKTSVT